MNKQDLIQAIAVETGLSKIQSKATLETILGIVSKTLVQGENVSLVGFGTFLVVQRAARKGINPATQQSITIPAKRIAKFKVGSALAKAVK
ncbi:MAG: HU family DNA-binding protein [Prevotellaceae bacterium]|jgi:DNA-binding protein HU-beta|nr:HU family DNA-binding protein [Prevotellaceae bacterium]